MDPTAHSSVQVTRTAEVWQQLARVTDPEMDESITDLGFVATLDIHANGVTVEFRLPTYWCAANFAFMMAEDIRDQVLNLAWVDSVNVRLVDHYSSAAINEGMANAASFMETFPSEATDDLSELRCVFRRKAFMTRQEKLLGHFRRSGWNTEDLLDLKVVVSVLHLPTDELDAGLQPRGYRLLSKIPRVPELVIDHVVEHFGSLQKIMRATVDDLDDVEGVGEARAQAIKEGLSRLAETSILDRYV